VIIKCQRPEAKNFYAPGCTNPIDTSCLIIFLIF
jgi:hypothetical protein